jgi:hypothetical protein
LLKIFHHGIDFLDLRRPQRGDADDDQAGNVARQHLLFAGHARPDFFGNVHREYGRGGIQRRSQCRLDFKFNGQRLSMSRIRNRQSG